MSWMLLVVAGLLEVGWAIGLKASAGLTRPLPALLTVVAMVASLALLNLAARTLPIGTAYAVWVGIGVVGTALLGILLYGESVSPARLGFLALLVIALVGLKLTGDA